MIAFRPAPARLAPGQRIYAVGDVHGCLDPLRALHARIAADLAARPAGTAVLIHLGDLIDRGPDSAGVVELLSAGPPPGGITEVVNLLGNHEAMLLAALEPGVKETVPLQWLVNGGADALLSWGVPRKAEPARWAELLPPAHLAFLRGLVPSHRAGGYLFVHAGVRPNVPFEQQKLQDLLWIREPFLSSTADHGAVVVHGHTPHARAGGAGEPDRHRHRGGHGGKVDMRGAGGESARFPDRVSKRPPA